MDANYRDLTEFRFWCFKVLPLVYDDELSYYEVICKCVDYINNLIENDKAIINDVEKLKQENYLLLDCQVFNPHLESLGAVEIDRDDFLMILNSVKKS